MKKLEPAEIASCERDVKSKQVPGVIGPYCQIHFSLQNQELTHSVCFLAPDIVKKWENTILLPIFNVLQQLSSI